MRPLQAYTQLRRGAMHGARILDAPRQPPREGQLQATKSRPDAAQGRLNLLLTLIMAAGLALLIYLFVVQFAEPGAEVAAGATTEVTATGEVL